MRTCTFCRGPGRVWSVLSLVAICYQSFQGFSTSVFGASRLAPVDRFPGDERGGRGVRAGGEALAAPGIGAALSWGSGVLGVLAIGRGEATSACSSGDTRMGRATRLTVSATIAR